MKKVHISFGDEKYYGSLKLLEKSSHKYGSDVFKTYTKEWLMTSVFWKENLSILSQPRGAGYWIWKPFIILNTFKELDENDIVLYTDAAMFAINDLNPLFELAEKNSIVVFRIGGGHINKVWTKRDCFILMDADKPEFHNESQLTASYSLWKKNTKTIEFLEEYQRYLKDPRIVTDIPSTLGKNYPEFKDHRHDQSVISILSQKHNIERFRDPSQFGLPEISQFSNSQYKQIFNHHRMKLFG